MTSFPDSPQGEFYALRNEFDVLQQRAAACSRTAPSSLLRNAYAQIRQQITDRSAPIRLPEALYAVFSAAVPSATRQKFQGAHTEVISLQSMNLLSDRLLSNAQKYYRLMLDLTDEAAERIGTHSLERALEISQWLSDTIERRSTADALAHSHRALSPFDFCDSADPAGIDLSASCCSAHRMSASLLAAADSLLSSAPHSFEIQDDRAHAFGLCPAIRVLDTATRSVYPWPIVGLPDPTILVTPAAHLPKNGSLNTWLYHANRPDFRSAVARRDPTAVQASLLLCCPSANLLEHISDVLQSVSPQATNRLYSDPQ